MKTKFLCVIITAICIIVLLLNHIFISEFETVFYPTAMLTEVKLNLERDADIYTYSAVQGACTDGRYAYFAIDNGSTTLLKYDIKNWYLVKKATHTTLGHANDMTFNKNTGQIIVSNNSPDFDTITFLDPETLKITTSKKISHNIYSISYNPYNDRYVVGISGGFDFAILNSNFETISTHKGYNSSFIRQGNDCDRNYIYFAQSGNAENIIVVYNWSGELVDIVNISLPHEIENIFHTKDTMYVSLFQYTNTVCKINISKKTYR